MLKGFKTLVAGLIAGTAIGIFFAPKKGSDTRKSLSQEVEGGGYGSKALKESLSSMGKDMKDTAKSAHKKLSANKNYQEGTKKLKEAASKAKKQAEEWIDKNIPEEKQKEIKETYNKAIKGLKDGLDKAEKAVKKAKKKGESTTKKVKKSVNKAAKKVAKKTSAKKSKK